MAISTPKMDGQSWESWRAQDIEDYDMTPPEAPETALRAKYSEELAVKALRKEMAEVRRRAEERERLGGDGVRVIDTQA